MKKKRLLSMVVVLVLGFVWGNSLLTGETSGAASIKILIFLRSRFPILDGFAVNSLRKIGHFLEFFLLGILSACFFGNQQGQHRLTMPLLFALVAANMDETIQLMVPGRGSDVLDVWIDVAGACIGIVVVTLVRLWRRKK